MAKSIFSKIISGEIPAHRVYEDDQVIAFLDVSPLSQGHTLLVPKEPAATLHNLSDAAASALGSVLPRLCRAVMKATGCSEYNVLQNNGPGAHQAVDHVHFHIIPKPNDSEGLRIEWPAQPLDPNKASLVAAAISQHLEPPTL